MYITINNIKGEKGIDLSYSIQNFDSDKEIAVIRMLSDNVKYEMLKLCAVMDPISDTKKTFQVELMQVDSCFPLQKGLLNLSNLKLMIKLLKRIN